MKFLVASAAIGLFPTNARALSPERCGGRLTSPCRSETDPRYDANYPTSIIGQDERWSVVEGYWKATYTTTLDGNGRPLEPEPYDPSSRWGFPYQRSNVTAFYNNTIVGSRYISNRYYFRYAAPVDFCQEPLQSPFRNSTGSAICGVNGMVYPAGLYGTSTHENNGELQMFRSYGEYGMPGEFVLDSGGSRVAFVNEESMDIWSADTVPDVFQHNGAETFLDDDTYIFSFLTTMLTSGKVIDSGVGTVRRMQREEWIAAIEQANVDYNVPPADQLPVPLTDVSLLPETYPTEWEWCGGIGQDPSCTTSQYQEPNATVNPGAIAGFCVLGVAVLVGGLYLWHRYRIRKTKERTEKKMRQRFVFNVARRISVAPSPSQIPVEKLEAEFDYIDKNKGGTIEKEELRAFINEGKLGQVSDSDFEALWNAMNVNGSSEVDFLEFCTFLSGCGQEFDEVHARVQGMTKEEQKQFLSRRFSGVADSLTASHLNQVQDDDTDIEKNGKCE